MRKCIKKLGKHLSFRPKGEISCDGWKDKYTIKKYWQAANKLSTVFASGAN
jgi:hypothetical protein